ncbi:hypothetical protein BV898_10131 [Hypsibius exemplaris]|uniref:Replication protein A 14 kDa subunit n=1 Tax=Hypsibius exemplaris TaxID=2072580 RepID=A0A1W0WKN7_HYPEX|nr:hypothetical protein BV898_10131 [Hypsibius exemplaris]
MNNNGMGAGGGDRSGVGPVAVARINGQMLESGSYARMHVSMIGKVEKVSPDGRFFRLLAPDNKTVVVRMKEPLTEALDGIVEVEGVAGTKNAEIDCHQYTLFGTNHPAMNKFDMAAFNEAIQMSGQYPQLYETSGG